MTAATRLAGFAVVLGLVFAGAAVAGGAVDVERSASGPFGGTIAHGYLTLSLIPMLGSQVFALETPGATAALVTPDRALALRVAAELARWGIVAEDSAGEALSLSPAGRLDELVDPARTRPVWAMTEGELRYVLTELATATTQLESVRLQVLAEADRTSATGAEAPRPKKWICRA